MVWLSKQWFYTVSDFSHMLSMSSYTLHIMEMSYIPHWLEMLSYVVYLTNILLKGKSGNLPNMVDNHHV